MESLDGCGFSKFLEMGFEQTLACTFWVLCVTVFKHMKIRFGYRLITHLTTGPFKVIYAFLAVSALESTYLLI